MHGQKTLHSDSFLPIPIQWIAVVVSKHARNQDEEGRREVHAWLENARGRVTVLQPLQVEAPVALLVPPYHHREWVLLRAGK